MFDRLKLSDYWFEKHFIFVDLETTGPLPVKDEICEISLIHWHKGETVETLTQLFRPKKPMSEEIIKIHGITNESVETAPDFDQWVLNIVAFLKKGHLVAHHAPFDMGFLARELEKRDQILDFPQAFCTSLLSRNLIPESPNHKLQTLRQFLNLPPGQPHRAWDDAQVCSQIFFYCLFRCADFTENMLVKEQGKELHWNSFSYQALVNQDRWALLIDCIEKEKSCQIRYSQGLHSGQRRVIQPLGLIRNPDGDYLVAIDELTKGKKRFYLDKIKTVEPSLHYFF